MTRHARFAAGALTVLACLGALTACGDGDVNASTDPVEVEVGKTFEWNGFAVEKGWELTAVKRSINGDEVETPEVKGTITNLSDEERAAIFEMVFSTKGDVVAKVSCSAATMVTDQSQQFICPGLGALMPEGYDAVVVREFVRDDGTGNTSS